MSTSSTITTEHVDAGDNSTGAGDVSIAHAGSGGPILEAAAGESGVNSSNKKISQIPEPAEQPYQPLVLVLIAFCAGIVIDRLTSVPFALSAQLWWSVAAFTLVAWYFLARFRRSTVAAFALGLAIASVGAAWHHVRWSLFNSDELGLFATDALQPVCIEAVAEGAAQEVPPAAFNPLRSAPASPQSRFVVDAIELRNGMQWQPVSGRVQVTVQGEMHLIRAGDRLRMFGELGAPLHAGNPGDFDPAVFARSNRELCVLRVKRPDCISVVQAGSAFNPVYWIDGVRQFGDRELHRYISPERAGMAGAVLLGEREEVDHETNEAFVETGTIHILCIAGLHLGILAWLLFKVFDSGWLSRRSALLCVMCIIGFYMLVTTVEPPVLRATLLIWIVCGGVLLGRARVGLNSLALAGIALLILNPADLFHTGVQLSFLSVAVLICAGQRVLRRPEIDSLDRLIFATQPWPQRVFRTVFIDVKEVFLVGLALWLAITPLTMARFHILSPSALVLNVLLTPVVTLVMVSGIGVLIFGAWLAPVANLFGWLCNFGLDLLNGAVKWFAHLPGARFWVAGPSDLWLVVFYLAVGAVVLLPQYLPPRRWWLALVGGWCGIGLLGAAPLATQNHALRCTFIDVGHGGAELLQLPDGKTLLYDAGKLGAPQGGAKSISNYLWSQGISHLDAVVLSHADTDHYNALPDLLERFSVGVVYVSPVMFKEKSKALEILQTSIEHSGAKLNCVYAGDKLRADPNVAIDVLHPPPDGVIGRDNANCVVLAVNYSGRRILLTGDLEPPGMQMVMNEPPLPCDVVQVPHHGSTYSEPDMFARFCTPKYAIICGGQADGKVSRTAYETHGAKVLSNADFGAITVTVDAGHLDVQTFRHKIASQSTPIDSSSGDVSE